MPVVKTTDYYKRYEEAGNLKDKDKIIVYWPDGTQTKETLHVNTYQDSMQIDMMGGPDRFTARKLVVKTKVRGIAIELPLRGLTIKRDTEGKE